MNQEQSSSVLGKRVAGTVEGNEVLVKQEPTKKTRHAYSELALNGTLPTTPIRPTSLASRPILAESGNTNRLSPDAGSSEQEDELDDEDDDKETAQHEDDEAQTEQTRVSAEIGLDYPQAESEGSDDEYTLADIRNSEPKVPRRHTGTSADPIHVASSVSSSTSTPEPSLEVIHRLFNSTQPQASPSKKEARLTHMEAKPTMTKIKQEKPSRKLHDNNLERLASSARRSESHWHLDGSIKVLVENILFKLHRSALKRQSKIFSDLIDAGERACEEIEPNRVPIIRANGNPIYFEAVLDAIEDGFALMTNENISPSELAPILIGSLEFGFTSLSKWAMQAFLSMWPDGMDEIPFSPDSIPYAVESVCLVRECRKRGHNNSGLDNVLKLAMYELVRKSGLGIREEGMWVANPSGRECEDEEDSDDSQECSDDEGIQHHSGTANKRQNRQPNASSRDCFRNLSPNDVRILIHIREKLHSKWMDLASKPPQLQSCGVHGCAYEPEQRVAEERGQSNDLTALPATPISNRSASSSYVPATSASHLAQTTPRATPNLCYAWMKAVHFSDLFEERKYDAIVGLAILAGRFSDEHKTTSFNSPQKGFRQRNRNKRRSSTLFNMGPSTQRGIEDTDSEDSNATVFVKSVDWKAHGICDSCKSNMANIFLASRQKIWGDLDGWLDD